jgi:hypothetical protein
MESILFYASVVYYDDKLLYLACLLLALPLSFGLQFIPHVKLKHLYGTSIGIGFCLINFGLLSVLYCLVTSLCVWKLINITNLKPIVTFVFSFLICSIAHLWIMYHDYLEWHMDFTGVQNILTLKFVMWAFNMYHYRNKSIKTKWGVVVEKTAAEEYDDKVVLDEPPTLLEYMSHLFWFSNVLTMPIFEPKQHLQWVKTPNTKGAWLPCIKALVYGLAIGVVGFVLQSYVPIQWMTTDEWAVNTNIVKRLGYMWLAMFFAKTPYYAAWLLAEASTVLCGMGNQEVSWLAPPDRKHPENGASVVSVLAMELARNFIEVVRAWNYATSGWLRHYVYIRVDKRYATTVTFFVSALWHGFYPGYYLSFMGGALHTAFGRILFRRFNKFDKLSTLANIGLILLNSFLTSYIFVGFILLGWSQCWHVYHHTYFVGYFIILGYMAYALITSSSSDKAKTVKNE